MKKAGLSRAITLSLLVALVVLVFFISKNFKAENYRLPAGETYSVNDGWTIQYRDQIIEQVSLPQDLNLDINEVYKAETVLPYLPDSANHLLLRSSMQNIRVFIDDAEVFKHEDVDGLHSISPPLSLWLLVELPEGFQGKTLTLEISSLTSSFSGVINPVEIGAKDKLLSNIVSRQMIGMIVFLLLFIIGGVIIVASFAIKFSKDNRLIYLGLLAWSCGLWILTEARLLQFFTGNRFLLAGMGYMMVPLITIFFVLYIKEAVLIVNINKQIFRIIAAFCYLMLIAAILLQISGISFFINTFKYLLFAVIIISIVGTSIMINEMIRHHNDNVKKILKYFVILLTSVLIEVILFFFEQFSLTSSYLRIGMLIFFSFLVLDSYKYIRELFSMEREKQILEELAYKDLLTGGANRTAYERDLELLMKTNKEVSFRLILLDLNRLKQINDFFGHNFGDEAIKKVYEAVKIIFNNYGICYRIGGDEFAVLMSDSEKEIYITLLERLRKQITQINSNLEYDLDIAVGSDVYIRGKWEDYSRFYQHVDKKMYADKAKRKRTVMV